MTARRWRTAAAICSVSLLALVLTGPAALAAKPKGLTLSFFKLNGSHGYIVEAVSGAEAGVATSGVVAKRGDLSASYFTEGKGGLGIHADLGSVGRVQVHFHRHKRVAENVSKGCRLVLESGIFRGEIEFDGEGGYTHAAARSVPGEVLRLPNGFCLFDDLKGPKLPKFLDTTTLSARSRTVNGSIEFEAVRTAGGRALATTATVKERIGEVQITRTAQSLVAKRTLRIKPGKPARKATLKLGSPFSGEAEFQDPADGPAQWTGSLGVALPGAPTVPLAGEGFAVRLCVDKGLFDSCKAKLPPAAVPQEPQL